jgi:hypothetical protein
MSRLLRESIRTRSTQVRCSFILFLMIFFWSATTTIALAKDYSFSWSAYPKLVAGYKLYYKKGGDAGPPFNGTDSSIGPSPITISKKTSFFTITGLQDNTTYHFALTVYDGTEESDFSQVITIFPQDSSPAPERTVPIINSIHIK